MVDHGQLHVADRDLSHVAVLAVSAGEEHVAAAISKEAEGLGAGLGARLSTDDRVPGRLLGRQEVYSRIGAEPYIVRSEFAILCTSSNLAFMALPCRVKYGNCAIFCKVYPQIGVNLW